VFNYLPSLNSKRAEHGVAVFSDTTMTVSRIKLSLVIVVVINALFLMSYRHSVSVVRGRKLFFFIVLLNA